MKKLQMDRDQRAAIERQNQIHSTKLSSIRQSHGRVDNWNYYPQRSLNIGQRHQNLSRIAEENGKILERILKRESEYGRWKSEYEKMERIRSNISRYPQDSRPAWEGQQTVTFMDSRRSQVNIYDLVEGSKSDCSQNSRSILQTAEHRTSKDPLYHTDKSRQITPFQAEKSTLTLYGDSTYCDSRDGSTYSFHKRGSFHSAEYERDDHKLQTRCNSRGQKCLSNSDYSISNANPGGTGLFLEDSDGRENLSEEDCVQQKCQSSNDYDQCTSQSKKMSRSGTATYRSTECEADVSDTETKTHMSVRSSQSSDFSPVDSDASSCYSLDDSDESPPPSPKQYSRTSKTLSSLSLDLKPKATSTSPTSQKSPEIAENSSHRTEISDPFSQYVSRSQNPSPEESKSHYSLLQPTKSNSGHSSRVTTRSTDSLSFVKDSNRDVVSPLTSMTANSPSSSSSTNKRRSPDLITHNMPSVTLTRDSRGASNPSNVSTKSDFEGKIYKALHYINEALYK